jgi:hypothetical protein
VSRCPSRDFLSCIRLTLRRLEEEFPAPEDQSVSAELKRIILLRIDDLEFVAAVVERENTKEAKPEATLAQVTSAGDIVKFPR